MPTPIANFVQGNGIIRRSVAVSFLFNGTSNPTDIRDPNGDVLSVVYGATATYTITMNYPVYNVLSMQASVQLASTADAEPQFGATSTLEAGSSSNWAVTVSLLTGASAATPPAANADNRMHLTFEFELSPNPI